MPETWCLNHKVRSRAGSDRASSSTLSPASMGTRRARPRPPPCRPSRLEVTAVSRTLRLGLTSARSCHRQLITPKRELAPCHPNANPVRRVSATLSATLQLGHAAPKCRAQGPRGAGAQDRVSASSRLELLASKWHSADRVGSHPREVDRPEPHAHDRKTLRSDVVVEAAQPPRLNRTAAAALLRIVLQAAYHDDAYGEGRDRPVQS